MARELEMIRVDFSEKDLKIIQSERFNSKIENDYKNELSSIPSLNFQSFAKSKMVAC